MKLTLTVLSALLCTAPTLPVPLCPGEPTFIPDIYIDWEHEQSAVYPGIRCRWDEVARWSETEVWCE